MSAQFTLCFVENDLRDFAELSGDRNPLHLDEAYAHQTPYGRRVVFGMTAVLQCLAKIAKGRKMHLLILNVQFKKPLFLDQTYFVEYNEAQTGEESTFVVRVTLEDTTRIKLEFRCKFDRKAPALLDHPLPSNCNLNEMPIGQSQLRLLCWTSYYVGMINPGTQALMQSVQIDFNAADEAKDHNGFVEPTCVIKDDPRLNRVQITSEKLTGDTLKIVAFKRPPPVSYSAESVLQNWPKPTLGRQSARPGRIFISGGSRGLGAVLVKIGALMGHEIVFNYHRSELSAKEIITDLQQCSEPPSDAESKISRWPGDIGSAQMWALNAQKIGSNFDVIILNAVPRYPTDFFRETAASEGSQFLTNYLLGVSLTLKNLLPKLNRNAVIVLISTVLTSAVEPRFSYYIAGKKAAEGLIEALSTEEKHFSYIVARPSRMLTDSTNVINQLAEVASPIQVGFKIWSAIENSITSDAPSFIEC